MLAETVSGWFPFAVIGYLLCGGAFALGLASVERPSRELWFGAALAVILWPIFSVLGLLVIMGRAVGRIVQRK